MATKRKREIDEDSMLTPNAKIAKQEEVTRSGRVRKKPAKFVDEVSEDGLAAELQPKIEPGVKIVSTPKPKPAPAQPVVASPAPAPAPVLVAPPQPPQPITKIVTIQDPVKIEDEIMAMEMKMEEDAQSAARRGRARKKSAKVLEMEEFEEAEKKQYKKDPGKKLKSPTSPTPGSKATPKSPTPGVPTTVAKLLSSPGATKIKDMQKGVKVEPQSPQLVQTSPVKVSPVGSSPKSPVAAALSSSPASSKGSVIKLLLSSPAQSTNPMMSTAVAPIAPLSAKSAKKKKAKEKALIAEDHAKIKQALEMAQVVSPVKQELMVDTSMVKTSAGGMKIKMSQLHKETVAGSAKAAAAAAAAAAATSTKTPPKEPKGKKGKKQQQQQQQATIKDESVFLPPPLPSPNVIHVGSMQMGMEMKSDVEFTQQKKKGKSKAEVEKQKAKEKMEMEAAMIDHEFGLDMSDINLAQPGEDSFMDIDDDDSLMIPESEAEVKPKSAKKKKASTKGKAGAKASHVDFDDIPTESDLVMDLSRVKPEDSTKRKTKKPVKDLPEETDKGSSKKKRAPTAYMLWCNEHRPKVVLENPGIDFSTISKTLGEMWSGLPEKEKLVWKRKAKKAAGKGSTLITTGKAASAQKAAAAAAAASQQQALALAKQSAAAAVVQQKQVMVSGSVGGVVMTAKQAKQQLAVDDLATPVKGFGIEPVDVAAHLKIVGESLSIIGMRLQEHRGLIAVQGSLSVLLDSMLCAVAPLLCLTSILPETNGLPYQTHMKNLDNIAYVMPGL